MVQGLRIKGTVTTKGIPALNGLKAGKLFAMEEKRSKMVWVRRFQHVREATQFYDLGDGKGGDMKMNAETLISIDSNGSVSSLIGIDEDHSPDFLFNQAIWCEDGKLRISDETYSLREITEAERKIVSVELL